MPRCSVPVRRARLARAGPSGSGLTGHTWHRLHTGPGTAAAPTSAARMLHSPGAQGAHGMQGCSEAVVGPGAVGDRSSGLHFMRQIVCSHGAARPEFEPKPRHSCMRAPTPLEPSRQPEEVAATSRMPQPSPAARSGGLADASTCTSAPASSAPIACAPSPVTKAHCYWVLQAAAG